MARLFCHCAMTPPSCSIAPGAPLRVIAPYARTLWDAALAAGVPPAQCGAPPGEDDVPVAQYLALLQQALAHAGPGFGWCLGQSVKPTSYGVNGILLLACSTLGEALAQVLRFEALVHDLGRSTLTRQGTVVVYEWRNAHASHPAAAALVESVFAGIHTCAQWLLGQPLVGVQVEFAHPAPDAATAAALAQASGAQLAWGAPAHRARFPAAWLDWPLPQTHPGLLPLLQRHAEELLRARQPDAADIVARVRQCISQRLGPQGVRLADVAADLQLAPRTLQRRLAEAGWAFQGLLDGTRHALACHYLRQTPMALADIGQLLGYQEAAAFHHAFKQWQGQGPGQYRARAGADLDGCQAGASTAR